MLDLTENKIEFKRIKDFPNYYISKCGKVLTLKDRHGKKRLLKPGLTKGKYYTVVLNGKTKYIHKLLAMTFLPNPNNLNLVEHLDDDKLNNSLDNLKWSTYSENNKRAYTNGMKVSPKNMQGKLGKLNPNSKKVNQFTKDNLLIKTWECISDVVRHLNIADSSIIANCKGRRKSAGGFVWRYVDGF